MIMFPPLRIRKFSHKDEYHTVERYAFLWDGSKRTEESIFCIEYERDEEGNAKLGVLFWDRHYGEALMDRGELGVRNVQGSIDEIVRRLRDIDPYFKEIIKESLSREANELLEATAQKQLNL